MANIQALNPKHHSDIKIDTNYSAELGHNQGAVMVLPHELRDVQREYPILFRKHHETGRLFPNALLGFTEHENLYLSANNQWHSDYVPMAFRKGPFLIGFKHDQNGQQSPILSIDMDDPRVSNNGDVGLFDGENNPSEYLNNINDILHQMHEDNGIMLSMIDAFNELNLIEPLTLDIHLSNGERINFAGAYTIAEEKLLALKGSALEKLNGAGFLSAAYYISGSLGNIQKLINIKNNQSI